MIAVVVAQGRNRVIGRDGALPWYLPADLRRFKALTLGHAVVMGRRTYESLPEPVRPLPGRQNVVLSAELGYAPGPGAEVARSLPEALDCCGGECFVVGGGAVYAQALPLAHRLYVTDVDACPLGDAFFPPVDVETWRCVAEEAPDVDHGPAIVFRTYERATA